MKKKSIYYFLLLLTLLFTGCEATEDSGGMDNGKMCDFQFCLKLPESISVETKVTIGDEKITVNNVWILQYNASGEFIKSLYKEDKASDDNDFVKENDYMVRINTDATSDTEKFSDIVSCFYIIVNGGETLLKDFKGTETELKATTVDFTAPTGSTPTLLTSGPSKYDPKTTSSGSTEGDKKVVFVSRLFRAYAKVTVRVQFNDASASLSDMTATITNIPTKMALYTAGGGSSNSKYPATIDGTTMKTTETAFSGLTSTAGSSAYFCMPENLRGLGISESFEGKNKESNGPGSTSVTTSTPDGKLTGCTYLTLKGTYKYASSHTAGIKVEYRFYLGDNLTNNYNIQRDHHYDLTINIKGANSADLRVKITDGNVAVFDDVDTIENEVSF
ncbi:DUF4906 domain-containing protein [Parabacteroides sp. BX2]|jgi:hypothetical protein|uniref:DUF4906 domain-containing protein n=1 Tax=Parabacteroides segnis TaxID=2763058 RepID=A0ABR7E9E4_9BACT|nr:MULTISPECIES: DUF4906 domain-containing protein [Parabacteroides]MBC5646394.1 DUF4906 domain-containing protein [Parabacteroides segnis]MCM0714141.1 DUF4906 domain-containing protein [Parabacteroides sp. TA-V-105]